MHCAQWPLTLMYPLNIGRLVGKNCFQKISNHRQAWLSCLGHSSLSTLASLIVPKTCTATLATQPTPLLLMNVSSVYCFMF